VKKGLAANLEPVNLRRRNLALIFEEKEKKNTDTVFPSLLL